MNENKHTPDIKCYRINYNSEYWANVAAKVGNQCSSPVGAFFAVNALCGAYEDIAKQRDELLEQVERSNITEKNMEGRLNKLIVQYAATKDRLGEHRDGRLSALEKLAVAEKQRDELLAALENTHNALKHFWPEGHVDAIAAIASVKENSDGH